MNIDRLVERINVEHDTTFVVDGQFEFGESRSTYRVRDQTGEWVLKYHDDTDCSHLSQQRALDSLTKRLRSASYPVPLCRLVGRTSGTTYMFQERLAGEPLLAILGDPPDGRQVAAILPELLELNELQAGVCHRAGPGWSLILCWPAERSGASMRRCGSFHQ